jgi:hypothetical protein
VKKHFFAGAGAPANPPASATGGGSIIPRKIFFTLLRGYYLRVNKKIFFIDLFFNIYFSLSKTNIP